MALNDLELQIRYLKPKTDIAEEFYNPCMRESVVYNRISGYFSSSIYLLTWNGLREFIQKGGKMKLICSPNISYQDHQSIEKGYRERTVMKEIDKEIELLINDEKQKKTFELLATLISLGILEIKISYFQNEDGSIDAKRIMHDKIGIFEDEESNTVVFAGSMNETYKGLSKEGNMESITVITSSDGDKFSESITRDKELFDNMWDDKEPSVKVSDMPTAMRKKVLQYKRTIKIEELDGFFDEVIPKEKKFPLRKHQKESIENWHKNGRRGIFQHATGSGKTYTAINVIDEMLKEVATLVVVPSVILLEQWEEEISKHLGNQELSIILCGGGNNEWKKPGVLEAWTTKGEEEEKKIVIATLTTAKEKEFFSRIHANNILLVVDEVHSSGSTQGRNLFSLDAKYRLGLSATPKRYSDPEGTAAIMEYFGGVLDPIFTIEDAIKSGSLTKYHYGIEKCRLEDDEQEKWEKATKKIQQYYAELQSGKSKKDHSDLEQTIKKLLIERARIVKNARQKNKLATELLEREYKDGQRWIVYCDNKRQLEELSEELESVDIETIQYYTGMQGDPKQTLKYFDKIGGVMLSIKCLDEGVDIPSTTHALILASSKNPREHIQRRGRILRKSEGKYISYLYDLIVLPQKKDEETGGNTIIEGELSRAYEFARHAITKRAMTEIENIATEYGYDFENIESGGMEDE